MFETQAGLHHCPGKKVMVNTKVFFLQVKGSIKCVQGLKGGQETLDSNLNKQGIYVFYILTYKTFDILKAFCKGYKASFPVLDQNRS